MSFNFIDDAIFSFGEAMNLVKSPTSEEEYKKWVTPYEGKSITKTWSEVLTKKDSLEAEWIAQEYARKRQAEFPSIKDLVVALYDENDRAAIDAKRAEVKLKYPKP